MKIKNLLLAAILAVLSVPYAWSQATMRSTTLGAAVARTGVSSLSVASASGVTVGMTYFVDRERGTVTSISGTTLGIRRTSGITAHASGATIYIDLANYFGLDPSGTGIPYGTCTATNELVLPRIDTATANRYDCLSSVWKLVGGPGTVASAYDSLALNAAGTIVGEGTTDNAFETTLDFGDPTTPDKTVTLPDATGTVMVSTLATNGTAEANSVYGASNALVFEGATANTVETSIIATDPTSADASIALPNMVGVNGSFVVSTLTTNAPDAANSVTGASNSLVLEGATADAFETSITLTDPTADVVVTVPNAAVSGAFRMGQIEATFFLDGEAAPTATDRVFFIATRNYLVMECSQIHSVAAGGASTLQVTKDASTNAPGAGTDLLTAAFNLNATANTVQAKATADFVSAAARAMVAGDRLAVDFADAIQATIGVIVTCSLIPN